MNHFGQPPATSSPRIRVYTLMATWCSACKKELPQIAYLKSRFAPEEVGLFGLPADETDDSDKLRHYVQLNRPEYEIIGSLTDKERENVMTIVAKTLGQEALPSTIVTDANGKVLQCLLGVPSVSDLRRLLARLP